MGEYADAEYNAQRSIALAPDNPNMYLGLADILIQTERFDEGEAALSEALSLNPDSPRAYLKLAEIRQGMNETNSAAQAIDKALEMMPDMPILWAKKAQLQHMANMMDNAWISIDKALSLAPRHPTFMSIKADMLLTTNNKKDAQTYIQKALDINDSIPGLYYALTSFKKFAANDPEIPKMEELVPQAEEQSLQSSALIHYALFRAHEDIGNIDKAFDHLQKGNNAKGAMSNYNPDAALQSYANTRAQFTREIFETFEGKGHPSDVPVFIVGMPRSGTTLTEQILSSHPDIYGAGELTFTNKIIREKGPLTPDNAYALGEYYLELIKTRDPSGTCNYITDKMPGNFSKIGLIHAILPHAKIIHCRRNPMDTILSCYKQNFASGQLWSYDMQTLAEEYNRYDSLMKYWEDILPKDRIYTIDYENTVGDFETQARKLIDFVGLSWDNKCLEPHKQKRTILTASKAQVIKPVYQSSVKGWKKYETHLKPAYDALDKDIQQRA